MSPVDNVSVIGGDLICIPHELDLWAEVNGRGGPVGLALKDNLWGLVLHQLCFSLTVQETRVGIHSPLRDLCAPSSKPSASPGFHLKLLANHRDNKNRTLCPQPHAWHITVYMTFSRCVFLLGEIDRSNYSYYPAFIDEKPRTQKG